MKISGISQYITLVSIKLSILVSFTLSILVNDVSQTNWWWEPERWSTSGEGFLLVRGGAEWNYWSRVVIKYYTLYIRLILYILLVIKYWENILIISVYNLHELIIIIYTLLNLILIRLHANEITELFPTGVRKCNLLCKDLPRLFWLDKAPFWSRISIRPSASTKTPTGPEPTRSPPMEEAPHLLLPRFYKLLFDFRSLFAWSELCLLFLDFLGVKRSGRWSEIRLHLVQTTWSDCSWICWCHHHHHHNHPGFRRSSDWRPSNRPTSPIDWKIQHLDWQVNNMSPCCHLCEWFRWHLLSLWSSCFVCWVGPHGLRGGRAAGTACSVLRQSPLWRCLKVNWTLIINFINYLIIVCSFALNSHK